MSPDWTELSFLGTGVPCGAHLLPGVFSSGAQVSPGIVLRSHNAQASQSEQPGQGTAEGKKWGQVLGSQVPWYCRFPYWVCSVRGNPAWRELRRRASQLWGGSQLSAPCGPQVAAKAGMAPACLDLGEASGAETLMGLPALGGGWPSRLIQGHLVEILKW